MAFQFYTADSTLCMYFCQQPPSMVGGNILHWSGKSGMHNLQLSSKILYDLLMVIGQVDA